MFLLLIIISFFVGAIPFGYIIVKHKLGIDIRKEGSGNIGSTNVKRVAGGKVSALVQFLDITKSLVPVSLALIFLRQDNVAKVCFVSLATILGHIYSPFLGFKGGKGINSLLGSFILLCPLPVLISVMVHIVLKKVIKIVAIRSIILSLVIVLMSWLLGYDKSIVLSSLFASLIIIFAHRTNLKEIFGIYNIGKKDNT